MHFIIQFKISKKKRKTKNTPVYEFRSSLIHRNGLNNFEVIRFFWHRLFIIWSTDYCHFISTWKQKLPIWLLFIHIKTNKYWILFYTSQFYLFRLVNTQVIIRCRRSYLVKTFVLQAHDFGSVPLSNTLGTSLRQQYETNILWANY